LFPLGALDSPPGWIFELPVLGLPHEHRFVADPRQVHDFLESSGKEFGFRGSNLSARL
jgi:hypothetical protein